MSQTPLIIVALDFPTAQQALALVERLDPSLCRLKIGSELFTRAGPALIERLASKGFTLFLDLKYHDIPNTVAGACQAAAELGVWMLTLHLQGGRAMLDAAREAMTGQHTLIVGVTVLTSLDENALHTVGIERSPAEQVAALTHLALQAGLDGVVCSPLEAASLRQQFGNDFYLVTPGIRDSGSNDDQRRTLSGAQAIRAGADYLVIGRPITRASDPLLALQTLNQQLRS